MVYENEKDLPSGMVQVPCIILSARDADFVKVPQEFDDLVREALEMRGDSQRRAIAGVLQRIRMRSRRINQGIRPLGN